MPYVYKIENKITHEFYYGARFKVDKPDGDLWVKYFTSSKSIKRLIELHGRDSFTVDALEIYANKDQCFWKEQDYIKENIHNVLCINKYSIDYNGQPTLVNKGHTEETCAKISKSNQNNPKRQGKVSPFKGRKMTSEQKRRCSLSSKIKRELSIDGVVYESINSASKALSLTPDTIQSRCKSKNYPAWFKTGKQTHKLTHTPDPNSKQNIANKLFIELYELEKHNLDGFREKFILTLMNIISTTYISAEHMYRIARNNSPNITIPYCKIGDGVTINGVEYVSIARAAELLGVTIATVAYRIKSPKYTEWYKAKSVYPG